MVPEFTEFVYIFKEYCQEQALSTMYFLCSSYMSSWWGDKYFCLISLPYPAFPPKVSAVLYSSSPCNSSLIMSNRRGGTHCFSVVHYHHQLLLPLTHFDVELCCGCVVCHCIIFLWCSMFDLPIVLASPMPMNIIIFMNHSWFNFAHS